MLKTRLELLEENFYIQTLGKVLQHEINIKIMEERTSIAQPSSTEYTQAKSELPKLKKGLEGMNTLLTVILELIKKEKGKNGKKV